MATIVDNPKYGPGHQIILKPNLSTNDKKEFEALGYRTGVSVFELARKVSKPSLSIVLGSQSKGTKLSEIFVKDKVAKIISIQGTKDKLNGIFNHYSSTGKSSTNEKTKLKEEISLGVFAEWIVNNKTATEKQATDLAQKLGLSKHYETIYYESALKQLDSFKKMFGSSRKYRYTFERQKDDKTKWLYQIATKLSGLQADNWNPADIWIIDSNIKSFKDLLHPEILKYGTIEEVNDLIATLIQDKRVFPISLKQITAARAAPAELITAQTSLKNANLDFSFQTFDLSESFKNFIIWTKSGFGVRVGYKASSETLSVSAEARFKNQSAQVGGIDAKALRDYVYQKIGGYELRSGNFNITKRVEDTAISELVGLSHKHPRLISYDKSLEFYQNSSELEKKRLINLLSYLYIFAYDTLDFKNEFEDLMKFCYYTSKKVSSKSSNYILIR